MTSGLKRYYNVRSCRIMPTIHCLNKGIVKHIYFVYIRKIFVDHIERCFRSVRESIFGVDCSIFDKTILYYKEVKKQEISHRDALAKALDKRRHKDTWFTKERDSIAKIMHFYQEDDFYLFRHPYNHRFGCFRWYIHLVDHIKNPSVLEYGCGSAVLTEWWKEKFPNCNYTVADIPSASLDFVKWKKAKFNYNYNILTIGLGKEGIPLSKDYDLIICQAVFEHTPNPVDIVTAFVRHLSGGGVLITDFIKAPGGENLEIAIEQREEVKNILNENLIALKAIDKPEGHYGLYLKDTD